MKQLVDIVASTAELLVLSPMLAGVGKFLNWPKANPCMIAVAIFTMPVAPVSGPA